MLQRFQCRDEGPAALLASGCCAGVEAAASPLQMRSGRAQAQAATLQLVDQGAAPPLGEYLTFLRVQRYRVKCPNCGLQLEPLPFVAEGARVTWSLAKVVYEMGTVMSGQAVAIFHSLHRGLVKAIDKWILQKLQAKRSLEGITVLGADEIAVGKGHHYWTLISALEGSRGPERLSVVEGRSEKHLKRFWRWFGKERAAQITHAVIAMGRAFENSFRAHGSRNLQIIYDKFHGVRHLNEALNAVRKSKLRKSLGCFRKTLSGKKFVLLARKARVRGKAREALDAILAASPRLAKAHLLRESFGPLWDYTYRGCALRFWEEWKAQLKWSRLKPYHKFVRLVERHLDGILAHCDRAYGYRDKEYMKLKIIQACTPWMGTFRPWEFSHKIPPLSHVFSSNPPHPLYKGGKGGFSSFKKNLLTFQFTGRFILS